MKVNMTPNPLDVVTIHASQGDSEARQWEFELHNNGELIDTSEVTEQMFFKAYKGGTEQILPENTSTPTTTPILADIQYPDGLRTDQYFTYRETPTTVSNKARIKTIKGNTLVWNQLVQNGNFADTSIWSTTGTGSSFTVSNNIATVTAGGAYDRIQQNVQFISGHKYLIKADVKKTNANDDIRLYYGTHLGAGSYAFANTTEWQTLSIIKTATENITTTYPNVEGNTSNLTWQQRNMMIIDLTKMGLDITDPAEFTSLFSLPYYDYNQGSLLSFNGTGLKSTSEDESREDTLTLPVSTYFPTGMKQAGSVYDELTENKAITRIGAVDLGTLTYTKGGADNKCFTTTGLQGLIKPASWTGSKVNAMCIAFTSDEGIKVYSQVQDKTMGTDGNGLMYFYDSAYESSTVEQFKSAMSNVYLYYELATPTETSFTTASLVTENAEIPLSNEDGVLIGKCTEQLSENPGFIDAKIKLSDADGECYSNKLQLHVERKPS